MTDYNSAHDDDGLAQPPPGYINSYERNINRMTKLRDPKTGKFTKKPKK